MSADHPRACGVYLLSNPPGASGGGSSPRVRGLHHWEKHVSKAARIIPARAGFTSISGLAAAFRRDHPRACGVYPSRPRPHPGLRGSSPRVRGLLGAEVLEGLAYRIIPARAGFTPAY